MNEPDKQTSPETAQEWMSAHLDGMLDADETVALQAYLDRTPEARAELDELKALVGHLGDLPEVTPPADLYARVRADIDTEPAAPQQPAFFITPWLRRAAGIAAVLLIARVGYHELQQEQAPRDARTVMQTSDTAHDAMLEQEEADTEEFNTEVDGGMDLKDIQQIIEQKKMEEVTPLADSAPVLPEPVLEVERSLTLEKAREVDRLEDVESGERHRTQPASAPSPVSVAKPKARPQPTATPVPIPGASLPSTPTVIDSGTAERFAGLDEVKRQPHKIAGRKDDRGYDRGYEGLDADQRTAGKDLAEMPTPARDRRTVSISVAVAEKADLSKDGPLGRAAAGGGFALDEDRKGTAALRSLRESKQESEKESPHAPVEDIVEEIVAAPVRSSDLRRRERDGAIWKQDITDTLGNDSPDDDLDTFSTAVGEALGDSSGALGSGTFTEDALPVNKREEMRAESTVARRPMPTGLAKASGVAGTEVGANAPASASASAPAPGKERPAFDSLLPRQEQQPKTTARKGLAAGPEDYYRWQDASNVSAMTALGASDYTATRLNGHIENETSGGDATKAASVDTLTLLGADKDARPMRIQASITDVDALIAQFSSTAKRRKKTPDAPAKLKSSLAFTGNAAEASPPLGGVTSGPHQAGKTLRVFKIDREDYNTFMEALAKIGSIEAKPVAPDPQSGWFFFKKADGGAIEIYLMVEPPVPAETDPETE